MGSLFVRLSALARSLPPRRRGSAAILLGLAGVGLSQLLALLPYRSFLEPGLIFVAWVALAAGTAQVVHNHGFDESVPDPVIWIYYGFGCLLALVHLTYRYWPQVGPLLRG